MSCQLGAVGFLFISSFFRRLSHDMFYAFKTLIAVFQARKRKTKKFNRLSTVVPYQNESFSSKWEFFIKMRAAFLAYIFHRIMKEGESEELCWKTLNLIGHYGRRRWYDVILTYLLCFIFLYFLMNSNKIALTVVDILELLCKTVY